MRMRSNGFSEECSLMPTAGNLQAIFEIHDAIAFESAFVPRPSVSFAIGVRGFAGAFRFPISETSDIANVAFGKDKCSDAIIAIA